MTPEPETKMNRRLLPLLALLPIFASFADSETLAPRVIGVDYNGESEALNTMPTLCVGAGRANEGLRADWQQQLTETVNDCGFRYLRFHGLLSDDMGVYKVDPSGNEVYNWQYIDVLFDAMLEMKIRPFVELGFMPNDLASGFDTIFWWKGNVTPPKDSGKWAALIQALVAHWTERYGEDEVLKWYFEVWNEPNLSFFWIGDKKGMSDTDFEKFAQGEYFKLYEVTAAAIKSVNPQYRVGGPATAGNGWIPETLDFCINNNVALDFITTHHYGVDSGFLDEFGNTGTVLSPNGSTISDAVKHTRSQIEASAKAGIDLHYTEWSTSYTPSDPVHDCYISAPFILHNLKGIGDAAQSMSYWTFTDIFEEAGPRFTPFHGGFGLTNYQGIHKPAYFAFKFFNQLGSTELKSNDPESWICKNENGSLQALIWDFTLIRPEDKVNNQDFYNKVLPAKPAAPVRLHVENLVAGTYQMTAYRVGYRSNDAYTAYLDMGSPNQLTRQQVKDLKSVSSGAAFLNDTINVGDDGVLNATFPMQQNDVMLVLFERML